MMDLWFVVYKISTPGESQFKGVPTDNRNVPISNLDINLFLNEQVSQFQDNRQNTINKIDKDISHLENDKSETILKGNIITFATHNIRGVNNSNDPIKSSQ